MPNHKYTRGDVVLVPFPFADLRARKVRPALVVSSISYHQHESDLIIATITSNIGAHTGPLDYLLSDWQAAGLTKPSVVKSFIATIEPSLIRYHIGHIALSDLYEVEQRLRLALGL